MLCHSDFLFDNFKKKMFKKNFYQFFFRVILTFYFIISGVNIRKGNVRGGHRFKFKPADYAIKAENARGKSATRRRKTDENQQNRQKRQNRKKIEFWKFEFEFE